MRTLKLVLVTFLITTMIIPSIIAIPKNTFLLGLATATDLHDFSVKKSEIYAVDSSFRFIYPRIGCPAILLNGSWFISEFKADYLAEDWNFFIVNEFYNKSLTVNSIEYNGEKYRFNLTIPYDVEDLMYDLQAKAKVNGETKVAIEPHAIKIYYEFPENLTFLHITDTHVRPTPNPANELLELLVSQANLIRPDFIIFSGDTVETGSSSSFKALREILLSLQVPIFIGGGNHDLDSSGTLKTFETYIAPENYSLTFGPLHLISLMVATPWKVSKEQVNWLDNELSKSDRIFKVVFFHYPPLNETGYPDLEEAGVELIQVLNKHNVTLVLSGHIHKDFVWIINGTHYVTTTTLGSSYPEGFYHGYRIIKYENGTLISYGYNGNNNRSIPFEKFSIDWIPNVLIPDLGALISIKNQLNLEISNATIQIRLKKLEDRNYIFENATLIELREARTEDFFVAYLTRKIKVNDSFTIRVYPENPQSPQILSVGIPETVKRLHAFTVNVTVENDASGVSIVEIHYKIGDSPYTTSRMEKSDENVYKFTFEGYEGGTNITFFIVAYDYSGLKTTSNIYSIIVALEEQPPPRLISIQTIIIGIIGAAIVVGVIMVLIKRRKIHTST